MSDRCRVATFNLENLDDAPDQAPSLAERIAALRPELLRLDADILCLQEVNGSHGKSPRGLPALDALVAGTPYAGFARSATESPSGGALDIQNLAILSRWPFASVRQIRHALVRPPQVILATAPTSAPIAVEWDRPMLQVSIALPGGARLHVINLHLRAPLAAFIPGQKQGAFAWKSVGGWAEGFALAATKRNGQALEARLAIEQIFDAEPEALVAVAGDFNAEATEVATRILRAETDDTGNPSLESRGLVPVEAVVPAERRYSVIHAGRALLLDHLLASRPLLRLLRGASIHNEGLGDELVGFATGRGATGSYHAPMVAEFALPKP